MLATPTVAQGSVPAGPAFAVQAVLPAPATATAARGSVLTANAARQTTSVVRPAWLIPAMPANVYTAIHQAAPVLVVQGSKSVSTNRAARRTARARRVAMTAAVGPARPVVPLARPVITAPAVPHPRALATRAPTAAARSPASRTSAEPVFRAVAPVVRTVSAARATAPTCIAVMPATPMSTARAAQMLASVVRSVV